MYRYFLVCLFILFATEGCKKDEEDSNALDPNNYTLPTLTTNPVSNISQNTAICGGRITYNGGGAILSKGVCWSTSQNPKVANAHSTDGTGTSDFASTMTGLNLGTTYYVRAYAVNLVGTGYGQQESFTTPDSLAPGVFYDGGIIFYLDTSGHHGMICAIADQSASAGWGCPGNAISGADGTYLGSGGQNTFDMIAGCDSSQAAHICADLFLNGFNDWFLPSKDELTMMYNVLKANGLGNFGNGPYWSSSEMTPNLAWEVVFSNGIVQGTSKADSNAVRAVRTF